MKIKGIQRLTLIDYPDLIACTLFTFGCNFRCKFCHNPELVLKEEAEDISQAEVLEFLDKRRTQLEGVCFTGGEPLLNIDVEFLKRIKEMGYKIKIDTNGSFPDVLERLIDLNLVDFVAMDIKASREQYENLTNVNTDLEKIERSIKLIARQVEGYEFRTTVLEKFHDTIEIRKIAEWLNGVIGKKPKKFAIQGFKNNGKFVDDYFNDYPDTTERHLRELRYEVKDLFEKVDIRV
jgi:pyruvate formate lyase activating enzyme